MSEGRNGRPKFRFGPFVVDQEAGELVKRGKHVKLQQQPLEILVTLLEKPRQVVTREELQKRVWPGDTFVDFEHSLNTAVKKLRQALGDHPTRPRYVETLPRRGYRFLADVEVSDEKLPLPVRTAGREVGKIFEVRADDGLECVIAPSDEKSFDEWLRLRDVSDDVGISIMITENRLLLVQAGNTVRVLSTDGPNGWCQTRILEGEHYGKAALIPRKSLKAVEG